MCCPICKVSVKAGTYDQHQCIPQVESSQSVSKDDLQVASSMIHQLLSKSPENVVEIPTRGTVSLHVAHVNAHVNVVTMFYSLLPLCEMTVRRRSQDKDNRNQLLRDAGMIIDIPPEQGSTMKADLAIPWNKLRVIRRHVHQLQYKTKHRKHSISFISIYFLHCTSGG